MWRKSMKRNEKSKLSAVLFAAFLFGMAVILPNPLFAFSGDAQPPSCDTNQFVGKENRANKYFEASLIAFVDQKDGSLNSCANVDRVLGELPTGTEICHLFKLPDDFCGVVSSIEGDPHNARVAGSLKVALFAEFQFAMGYLQAHPDRSTFVVAQLEASFRGILGNSAFRCQDADQAISDLNNLAANTFFAYILAPAENENTLLTHFFRSNSDTMRSVIKNVRE